MHNPRNFYVSPEGNDLNPGTESKPFGSIEKAREAVRIQLKKMPGKAIIVIIKGGNYYLEQPIIFTAEDSGKEGTPIVYKAAEGEEPVLTGSIKLSKWTSLEDAQKLQMFPPCIQSKLFVTDLVLEGVTDFGSPVEIGQRPELFYNGQIQTLARWPNEGLVKAGHAKGETDLPPRYINKHGTKEGVFEYIDDRQNRWANEDDVWLGGYWYWDWSDEFQRVEKIDTGSHTIHLCEPYHKHGYGDSLRYFGLNLFCEIDQPGEWYLDRLDKKMYWFAPQNIDPNNEELTLSVFSAPYMLEARNCSNIKIQELTFREGRGNAVLVTEGNNCRITDCRIESFGKDGIYIDGGSGHGISGCYLSTFGCSGIHVKGGDRKSLTPANHFIENTVVTDFSLFKRTYEPAVHVEGCGILISHNRFQNSSSSAMRLEGNDITVEYNKVNHVVNESDDQGGLDMWKDPSYRGIVIRYNHWADIKGGTVHGAAGIRLDDMISGVNIYGNVFERCGAFHFGGVQIHGGKDNIVENNLFYDCFTAVSFNPWSESRWFNNLDSPVIKKKILEDVDINSEIYRQKYPELKSIRDNINVNTVKNNLVVNSKNILLRDYGNNIAKNNSSIKSEGKAIHEFCKNDVLQKYGLAPIPLGEIGPINNKWVD